jgi:threonine dehydrogenase-like Zn-dependent dehydrogenase
LVLNGHVPEAEYDTMRAPFQEGDFPFPVKYGYSMVAERMDGPLQGTVVFALFPHQDLFCLPDDAVLPLPDGLDPARAVLAANMETALNIVWDSGVSAGDRVAVIGAGVVGALVAYLCAQMPGAEVTLCDISQGKGALAAKLGCDFTHPTGLQQKYDVIVNASAASDGLALALQSTGPGGTVVEASWYGEAAVTLPLGGHFHSHRLRLISSQVGGLPTDRLPRWTYRRRLAKALDLLRDDRLDVLVSGESSFATLPDDYAKIIADPETLCHRVSYL